VQGKLSTTPPPG